MRAEIERAEASGTKRPIEKFVLAALSSIPWIGRFLSAAASLRSEEETNRHNYLQMLWVEEHQRKRIELARLLEEIRSRFESLGSAIDQRIQSEGYLSLIRKTFRTWDDSDTEEKRRMLARSLFAVPSSGRDDFALQPASASLPSLPTESRTFHAVRQNRPKNRLPEMSNFYRQRESRGISLLLES